jgi:hypothetical protein
MKKFVVSYDLDYVHTVRVGVTAPDAEAAKKTAEEAFDAGTLWDNTADMPLLYDDFEEVDLGHVLAFEAQEVEDFPEPAACVREIIQRDKAFAACKALIAAYQRGEESESIDWEDVDQAYQLALKAMPHLAREQDVLSGDVVN